jgi:hypothetical protein
MLIDLCKITIGPFSVSCVGLAIVRWCNRSARARQENKRNYVWHRNPELCWYGQLQRLGEKRGRLDFRLGDFASLYDCHGLPERVDLAEAVASVDFPP